MRGRLLAPDRALAPFFPELVDAVGVEPCDPQTVPDARGQGYGLLPESRHHDRGNLVGQIEDARILDRVVTTAMGDAVSLPQLPDDLNRLFEHFEPDICRGPAIAEHMLVERLPAAHAPGEPTLEETGSRSGGMRIDGRVDADGGAGDPDPYLEPLRSGGQCPEDRPDERAVPLLADPGVEMIRDRNEVEPRLLGGDRDLDQLVW
jgi:hypothetical protein